MSIGETLTNAPGLFGRCLHTPLGVIVEMQRGSAPLQEGLVPMSDPVFAQF